MTHLSKPVEEIQAAVDKLTRLKSESTPGPWELEYSDQSIEVNAGTARTKWNKDHSVGRPAGSWRTTDRIIEHEVDELEESEEQKRAADAEMIVTLHATIDAQQAILAEALKLQRLADYSSYARMMRLVLPGLLLARAINGAAA